MEKGQIKGKITPEEYREALENIRIVKPKSNLKVLEFRGNFEYNNGKLNCFSARLCKKK